MKARYKVTLIISFFVALFILGWVYIQQNNIAVLEPKGMIGVKERDLIIIATLIMLIVALPVLVMALYFGWKYRASNKNAKYSPKWEHSYAAESVWWGVPFVIILVLAVVTWKSSHDLYPAKAIVSDKPAIEVQVVALEWKWLFIYPQYKVASLSFLQFPEKTPIHFEITADAPMNSFWIPQLGGQIYAMAAMRSQLNLIGDEVGEYKGCSANFSGKGFASMTFIAKVSTEQEFEDWVSKAKQSQGLNWESYQKLIPPSEKNPPTSYKLLQDDLFDQIIMKYMEPAK